MAGAHNGNHGNGGELPKRHMRRMPRTESRKMALFKELLEKETKQEQPASINHTLEYHVIPQVFL